MRSPCGGDEPKGASGWTDPCGGTGRDAGGELDIQEYQGFGYQVDLNRIAALMRGGVVLRGNIDAMLLFRGPPQAIRAATLRAIQKLAPLGARSCRMGPTFRPVLRWSTWTP